MAVPAMHLRRHGRDAHATWRRQMAINVAEITSVLKREISTFEQTVQVSEVGTVIEVGDGIARIYGLKGAMAGERLEFQNSIRGQVFNLEEDSIGALIFGN